jgi:hypothetical protein
MCLLEYVRTFKKFNRIKLDELLECDCTLGYAVLYFIATFMVHDKLIVRVIVLLFKKKTNYSGGKGREVRRKKRKMNVRKKKL